MQVGWQSMQITRTHTCAQRGCVWVCVRGNMGLLHVSCSGSGSKWRDSKRVLRCIIQLRRCRTVFGPPPPLRRLHCNGTIYDCGCSFVAAAGWRTAIDDRAAIFCYDSSTRYGCPARLTKQYWFSLCSAAVPHKLWSPAHWDWCTAQPWSPVIGMSDLHMYGVCTGGAGVQT